jgi:hypothetical protein
MKFTKLNCPAHLHFFYGNFNKLLNGEEECDDISVSNDEAFAFVVIAFM